MPSSELLISSTPTVPFRIRTREVQEIDSTLNRIRLVGSKTWLAVSPADISNIERTRDQTGRNIASSGPVLGADFGPDTGSLSQTLDTDDLAEALEIGLQIPSIQSISPEDLKELEDKLGKDKLIGLTVKDSGYGLLVVERNGEFVGAFPPVKEKQKEKDWAGANYYVARAFAENGRILEVGDVQQLKSEATMEHVHQVLNPKLRPKNKDGKLPAAQSIHQLALQKLPTAGRSVEENRSVQFERVNRLLNEAYQAKPEDRANILVKARGAITQNPTDKSLHLSAHVKEEAEKCIERGDPAAPEADELLRTSHALDAQQWEQMERGRGREVAHSL